MSRFLRKLGKDKILERINAFQNNEYTPNDILSSILSGYSKLSINFKSQSPDRVDF